MSASLLLSHNSVQRPERLHNHINVNEHSLQQTNASRDRTCTVYDIPLESDAVGDYTQKQQETKMQKLIYKL